MKSQNELSMSSDAAHHRFAYTKARKLTLFALIGIGLFCALLLKFLMPLEVIADEVFHLAQIILFSNSESYILTQLTMPPSYHWIIGNLSSLFLVDTFSGIRFISGLCSFVSVLLAWRYFEQNKPAFPFIQALQLLAVPLLWPFFWVLYTDIPALASIFFALLLVSNRQYFPAALMCVISLMFRQHNIFWALLMWAIALGQEGVWLQWRNQMSIREKGWITKCGQLLWQGIKHTSAFAIPILLFIGFLYWNEGITLGDKDNQKFGGLYPLQPFFFLLLFGFICLPLHLYQLPKILRLLTKHYWPWLVLVGLFFLYMATFKIVHPHNFPSDYFLRNWLLYFLNDHFRYKVLAFGFIALSLLSLVVSPLRSSTYYWLFPISLLALLPVPLVEQRYYIVPFSLWMLFRVPQKMWIEIILLGWFALMSAVLTRGIIKMQFFL